MNKTGILTRIAVGFAAALTLGAVVGCSSMYDAAGNWAVLDSDVPEYASEYDVFYLYPSTQKACKGMYLNWHYADVSSKIRRQVRLPLERQFGPRVRVFSPFVPQLGFEQCHAILKDAEAKEWKVDWYDTDLQAAIKCTAEALSYYLSIKSTSHPFILMGDGQGALILYEAMKRCSAVKPANGFVAAYFFGIPGITPERIADDFGGRGIKAATEDSDVGVIAVSNLRLPGDRLENTFATRGGAVINPLNWRTDATPAAPKEHVGAVFYDPNEANFQRQVKVYPEFCGAVADPENGLVELTDMSPKGRKFIHSRQFGSELWGVFGMCVSRNANLRVRMYDLRSTGISAPEK